MEAFDEEARGLIVVFSSWLGYFDVSILRYQMVFSKVHQHLNMETVEMSWSPRYVETGESGSPQNVTKIEHGNSHKNAQKYHFSTHADIKSGNIIPCNLEADLVIDVPPS
ncbi:hypothetical protein Tco_0377833 [Tanacetum coccineum]